MRKRHFTTMSRKERKTLQHRSAGRIFTWNGHGHRVFDPDDTGILVERDDGQWVRFPEEFIRDLLNGTDQL